MHTLYPEKWVDQYGDYLYNIALYRVNNTSEAEDLVQDTFLSAIKSKDQFRGECSEKTFLVKILNFKIIDYYRSKKNLSNIDEYLNDTEAPFTEQFFILKGKGAGHFRKEKRACEWKIDEEHLLDNERFYVVFLQCIEHLPKKLSTIIRLKFIEDAKSEEICKEMDISSSNYWTIIHRSKILLRQCIENKWFKK